ncbi:MAG: sugar phosphate isomerase/epimerase family protein [Planctomycetota bacterium]|nr:sugar phosphate isomerase/epimerase family protein [Planctomycetota bacterium]
MRKISVNQLTTMLWSFEEDIVHYSKEGFDRVGVCRDKANDLGIEKCKELLLETGISVSSYGSVGFFSDISGPSLNEQISQARKDIQDAAIIGADRVILHTGGVGNHLRKNKFCVARTVLDELLLTAEEQGVALAIEPLTVDPVTQGRFSHSLWDCKELIDWYESPWLGLTLDLFHTGNSFLEMDAAWFSENVHLVQLSDFRLDKNPRSRCEIGHGDLNLDAFCKLVEESRYEGVFEFELFGEQFDLISYEQVIKRLATGFLSPLDNPSVEFESMKA